MAHPFLEAAQEDEDGHYKEAEYESAHDHHPGADDTASADEEESHLRLVLVEINTVHGNRHLHGFFGDVAGVVLDVRSEAEDGR